jgi:hypothetical protein
MAQNTKAKGSPDAATQLHTPPTGRTATGTSLPSVTDSQPRSNTPDNNRMNYIHEGVLEWQDFVLPPFAATDAAVYIEREFSDLGRIITVSQRESNVRQTVVLPATNSQSPTPPVIATLYDLAVAASQAMRAPESAILSTSASTAVSTGWSSVASSSVESDSTEYRDRNNSEQGFIRSPALPPQRSSDHRVQNSAGSDTSGDILHRADHLYTDPNTTEPDTEIYPDRQEEGLVDGEEGVIRAAALQLLRMSGGANDDHSSTVLMDMDVGTAAREILSAKT